MFMKNIKFNESMKNEKIGVVLKHVHVCHQVEMTVSNKLMIMKRFVNDNVTTAALAVFR